jgi:hypothetical protein
MPTRFKENVYRAHKIMADGHGGAKNKKSRREGRQKARLQMEEEEGREIIVDYVL